MERKESEGLALPKGKRRVSWKIEDRPTWWPIHIDNKSPTGLTAYKSEELDLLMSSYRGIPQTLPDLPEDLKIPNCVRMNKNSSLRMNKSS